MKKTLLYALLMGSLTMLYSCKSTNQEATVSVPTESEIVEEVTESLPEVVYTPAELTAAQMAVVEELGLDKDQIALLEAKPLYTFTEDEVGVYLAYLSKTEPDLKSRIQKLGRKNLGQPYEIYLLGEFPFETYDPQPLYCLDRSDCVVFSEHTYAMALSHDWPSFFTMLQRIRYENGQIGVVTRNHYTESDWDVNNSWLVSDISETLAGERTGYYTSKFDRSKFLRNRYKLETSIPVEEMTIPYVPYEIVPEIESQLRTGDFVNVIVGFENGGGWATHTGLISVAEDGTVNFLHSTPPMVREEPIAAYIARGVEKMAEKKAAGKSYLWGFKFLRLQDDPIANLMEIDGPEAPVIQPPMGSRLTAR